MSKHGKKLIVDVDLLVYKAASMHHNRETNKSISPFYVVVGTFNNIFKNHNDYLKERFKIEDVVLLVSSEDKSNFRYNIQCEDVYKANRAGSIKPPDLVPLKEYVCERIGATMVYGQEADDAIGIEACSHSDPLEVIVSSSDKDLRMIPGIYWDHNLEHEPFLVTDPGFLNIHRYYNHSHKTPKPDWKIRGCGLRWFYYQLLSGDTADNIRRPWRYRNFELLSHAIALNNLYTEKTMFDYVLKVYLNHGSSLDRLVTNGQFLWIRRKPDELWQAPQID